jgi:hypothetical protein
VSAGGKHPPAERLALAGKKVGFPPTKNLIFFLVYYGLSMTRLMLYFKRISIAADNNDFHLFAVGRRAESIGGSPAIGRKDDFNLVELPAGRTGDPQFAGGFGKFNLNGLSTRFIAAINPLLKSLHINPHPFHAKP